MVKYFARSSSAYEPDPLDPQYFGFLDPDPDPRGKKQPKTTKKILLSKPKSELLKKERL